MKTSLTGIKPTHIPHIGNYLGAIRPALRLSETYRTAYFIADYHALTTVRDPAALRGHVHDVAATWLACGLDPEKTLFYRQSDVPEVFELSWALACVTATGQLERGVAYKDALARGEAPNAGIFYYPVLMAADILLFDTDVGPIGADQKQHVELARDMASRVNHLFGEGTLVVPEPLIGEAPLVPGLDGQKMSKSKGNTIPLFEGGKKLRKLCMSIVTGSETLEEPKPAHGTTVFEIYRHFASEAEVRALEDRLAAGNFGWGHAKEALYELLERSLAPARERFVALRSEPDELDRVLARGAERARQTAQATLARVRSRIGVR
ncbi:MAG: tryptophan--tRNA ligase [Deltaproteobacteria bacterium]